MKIEENKSNDLGNSKGKSNEGEDGIRSRLRKNPNKTKYLYTGDFNDQKSKKKNDVPSPENVKELCRSIVELIKKDDKSTLFRQPAIRSFSTQKDKEIYRNRIKEPRDLGYITKKLKLEDYTLKNFYDDMELCWSNALEFNESNTEAYQCAVYLKELANKLYKEKGIWELINKEKDKDKEKETNSNNNNSSNMNTNNNNTTPNRTPIKTNKKEKNKEKAKKENDMEEKTESISSNSNSNNKNTDSSYSSELKNSKIIGRKRKRPKNKEEKKTDKSEEKNKSEEKDKQLKKRGRRKKAKEENNTLTPQPSNKLTLEDIKKKFPNHQIVSGLQDLEKLIKRKNKKNSKNKMNGDNSKKNNNDNNNSSHNNKRKNKNNQNNTNIITNSNTNDNSPSKLQKEIKKACYEFISEMLVNGTFSPNNLLEKSQQINPSNSRKNSITITPMKLKYKNTNKEMANYDINCNKEISYNKTSNSKNKKTMNDLKNKINKSQNNNNEVKNTNNATNGNNPTKAPDKKEDKNMQLRIEIAKYFDILTDNDMINVLVFIENIRPQSLRVLQNDTIYIDMEAFNEDTFKKVFECVKKYV